MTPSDDGLVLDCEPVELGHVVAEKYRIVARIGQGGMGTVFEAHHTLLQRRFAIKFLRPHLSESNEMLARFRREALAAGRIEHDNVVAVTDFGVLPEGAPYIVMEFLVGETLSATLRREGALTVPRAVSLVVQACQGVVAAHSQGVVHRDLKPDNLFVCRRGLGNEHIKVVDFGIAKLNMVSACEGLITSTGSSLGTPYYMSPEQARGESSVDQRADVYSLGAVLYECLCGAKAHPGTSYNEILYHVFTQRPTSLREQQSLIPRRLEEIVQRAMAPSACDRYGQVSELQQALMPFALTGAESVPELGHPRSSVDSERSTLVSPPTIAGEAGNHLEGSLRPVLTSDVASACVGQGLRRWSSGFHRITIPVSVTMALAVALVVAVRRQHWMLGDPPTDQFRKTADVARQPVPAMSVTTSRSANLGAPATSAASLATTLVEEVVDASSKAPRLPMHGREAACPSGAASCDTRSEVLPYGTATQKPVSVRSEGSIEPIPASPSNRLRSFAGPGAYDPRNPYR